MNSVNFIRITIEFTKFEVEFSLLSKLIRLQSKLFCLVIFCRFFGWVYPQNTASFLGIYPSIRTLLWLLYFISIHDIKPSMT